MDDRLVRCRVVPLDDRPSAHAVFDPGRKLALGQFGTHVTEDGPRVVGGLEQTRNVGDDHLAQERRMVLRLGHIEVHLGQDSSVIVPPAACPVGRHRHEGIDQLLIRAGTVSRQPS